MSHKLAEQLGVKLGDKVKVSSARGNVTVKAMVTDRARPLTINGEETHMVWMPYSWGFKGLSKGPSTNYITIDALDPNVQEQEFKACLVNITKA
jgi:formate dehydrogenase major subunit